MKIALRSVHDLLDALLFSEAGDIEHVIAALRQLLQAFGPNGINHFALPLLTPRFANAFYSAVVPHEPEAGFLEEHAAFRQRLEGCHPSLSAFAALLTSETHYISHLYKLLQSYPNEAFDADLKDKDAADLECLPFHAGRLLNYLDGYTEAATRLQLASLVPDSVLRPLRAARERGRWGVPRSLTA